MRYTFDRMVQGSNGKVRLDTTTNVNEITEEDVTSPRFLEVTDNLKPNLSMIIRDVEGWEGWLHALECYTAWKDAPKDTAWNPVKRTWEPFAPMIEVSQHEEEKKYEAVMDTVHKPKNNKNAAAASKPKVSAVPPIAFFALGAAMQNGADKYGKFNWRESEVTASVFYEALHRHLAEWYNGEDFAGDSGVNHLAHIMAGCAIILDAVNHGCFIDDRSVSVNPVVNTHVYKRSV